MGPKIRDEEVDGALLVFASALATAVLSRGSDLVRLEPIVETLLLLNFYFMLSIVKN